MIERLNGAIERLENQVEIAANTSTFKARREAERAVEIALESLKETRDALAELSTNQTALAMNLGRRLIAVESKLGMHDHGNK